MKTIVANWKSNKTISEAKKWLEQFSGTWNRVKVIICPPYTSLPLSKEKLSILTFRKKTCSKQAWQFSIFLGAQDVSPFENGAYTGEISARMLKGLADYVIVGHSERRKHFGETDQMVVQKIKMAAKYGLVPIVCISNLKQVNYLITNYQLPITNYFILYEPLFAIGSGQPDTPESANKMAKKIKKILGRKIEVLYGGSVTQKNVVSFLSQPEIAGVGVGDASLNPQEFLKIIENASKI